MINCVTRCAIYHKVTNFAGDNLNHRVILVPPPGVGLGNPGYSRYSITIKRFCILSGHAQKNVDFRRSNKLCMTTKARKKNIECPESLNFSIPKKLLEFPTGSGSFITICVPTHNSQPQPLSPHLHDQKFVYVLERANVYIYIYIINSRRIS